MAPNDILVTSNPEVRSSNPANRNSKISIVMIRKKEEIEANNFRIKTRTILTATEAHKLKSAKANTSKNNNNNKDYFIKSAKEMLKNRCTSTEANFEKI